MKELNINQFTGNLVRDPEQVATKNGKILLKFTIAYNSRSTTDSEGSHANYLQVEAWEKLAEAMVPRLKKGLRIVTKGELVQKRWKDQDGKTKSQFVLVANTVMVSAPFKVVEATEVKAA